MGFVRKLKIISTLIAVLLPLVIGAYASPFFITLAQAATTAAALQSQFAWRSEQDARWTGLGACLKGSNIAVDAIDVKLDTYGIGTPQGDTLGTVTYGNGGHFKFGPVTWTFAPEYAPPASAEPAVVSCIHQAFGPHADSSHWVKPYRTTVKAAEREAASDPRWVAVRKCFTHYKISFSYHPAFPTSIIATNVGVVEYGHLIGFTNVGRISYMLNKGITGSFGNAVAFTACLGSVYL